MLRTTTKAFLKRSWNKLFWHSLNKKFTKRRPLGATKPDPASLPIPDDTEPVTPDSQTLSKSR
eukprot:gene20211-7257_t